MLGDNYWKQENSVPDTDKIYGLIKNWAHIHTLSPGQSIIVGMSMELCSPLASRIDSDMTKLLVINAFYALCNDVLPI